MQATAHGIAKSRTRLSDFTFTFYIYIFFLSLSATFFSIAFYNTSYQIKKKSSQFPFISKRVPFPPYLVRSLICTVLWPLVLPKTGCRVFTILPQQALSNLKYQVLEAFYQLLSTSGLWLFPFLQYLRGIFQPWSSPPLFPKPPSPAPVVASWNSFSLQLQIALANEQPASPVGGSNVWT